MEAVHCCVDRETCVFRLWFCGVHVHCVLPQRLNFHDMKRGLSDSNQHGNNGVDRHARLSRACFSHTMSNQHGTHLYKGQSPLKLILKRLKYNLQKPN